MKFEIKDIGIDGIVVRRALDDQATRQLLQLDGEDLMPRPAHTSLDLRVYPAEDAVVVQGSLEGEFAVPCGRCLGPCVIQVHDADLRLTFFPPSMAVPDEEELTANDLDTAYHDGQTVDLAPMIRENMLLAVPISPVCSEACRGLCPQCGADLNVTTCNCEHSEPETSPWVAALSQVKVKE